MNYTAEQLRDMARFVIEAHKARDPRAMELMLRLAFEQGMDPKEVWRCIKWLAKEEQKEAA